MVANNDGDDFARIWSINNNNKNLCVFPGVKGPGIKSQARPSGVEWIIWICGSFMTPHHMPGTSQNQQTHRGVLFTCKVRWEEEPDLLERPIIHFPV